MNVCHPRATLGFARNAMGLDDVVGETQREIIRHKRIESRICCAVGDPEAALQREDAGGKLPGSLAF